MIDDLGADVPVSGRVRRGVSLVPSVTEAIAATCPHTLVGCTDYCIRPAHLDEVVGHEVARIRGTKNPDRAAITDLEPDLVVANQEENREYDVTLLRDAGVPVWVTRIDTVSEAISSLTRLLVEGFGVERPQWLRDADEEWNQRWTDEVRSAVVAVWRDPWICVGQDTYIADVLRHVGVELIDVPGESRYPHAELADLISARPDRVILPDEPYHFGPDDVSAFPDLDVRLVDGQKLAWYGPSMVGARRYLCEMLS